MHSRGVDQSAVVVCVAVFLGKYTFNLFSAQVSKTQMLLPPVVSHQWSCAVVGTCFFYYCFLSGSSIYCHLAYRFQVQGMVRYVVMYENPCNSVAFSWLTPYFFLFKPAKSPVFVNVSDVEKFLVCTAYVNRQMQRISWVTCLEDLCMWKGLQIIMWNGT